MKKALQISLAKTLFTIEEDAYARLESYLASVRKHFENTQGYAEIIIDIESRIAEQLLEGKHTIVTIDAIEKILESMGRVEDFDDGAEQTGDTDGSIASATSTGKKLYRNPDDAMIAGVASGIAAYIGVEKTWVRLAFFALTFFNGLGLMLYIILWIIMPEARSASQKLEMTGTPVTIETLSETVRERFDEIKQDRRGTFHKIMSIPGQIIGGVVRLVGPLLRYAIGSVLVFFSTCALVATLFAGGMLLSGNGFIAHGVPIEAVLPSGVYTLALLNGLLLVVIPFLLVLFAGISLFHKKVIVPSAVWLPMIGIWLVSLVISGFTIVKIVSNYETYTRTAPQYQDITRDIPLDGAVTNLELTNGISVTVVSGTSTVLRAKGQEKSMDLFVASVKNGTLSISRAPSKESDFCLFCWDEIPELVLEIPALDSISATLGSRVTAKDFNSVDTLALDISQGSRAEIEIEVTSLTAQIEQGSSLTIEGSAESATISAHQGSRIHAEDFEIVDAEIESTYGSTVDASVSGTLKANASYGARISYDGVPEVRVTERQGGTVVSNDSLEE